MDDAAAAGEAFAAGWALSGAPPGERFDAGLAAALATAETCPGPLLAEATLHLGHLEGVWADVYARQDALLAGQAAKVLAGWTAVTADAKPARMVALFRRHALIAAGPGPGLDHESPAGRRQHKKELLLLAANLARGMLAVVPGSDGLDDLLAVLATALGDAAGEGFAAALAVAAADAGHAGFSWDAARKDGGAGAAPHEAAGVLAAIIAAVVASIAATLVRLAAAGASKDEMTAAVQAAITDPAVTGLAVTHALTTALDAAWLAVYDAAGSEEIDWVTVGDARVCPVCDEHERDGPYKSADFPPMPAHYRCRCAPRSRFAAASAAALAGMYGPYLNDQKAAA